LPTHSKDAQTAYKDVFATVAVYTQFFKFEPMFQSK